MQIITTITIITNKNMEKELILDGRKIKYQLIRKPVKNINLRIKPDGTVNVSANRRIPLKTIEMFLTEKRDFIFRALEKYGSEKRKKQTAYFSVDDIEDVIVDICKEVYPYYKNMGIRYPTIKFRKMVSRWGSCHPQKGILTFNINLMYAPIECVQYVVYHEFTHFLVPNHSKKFYDELAKVCPDWKAQREGLKEIILR